MQTFTIYGREYRVSPQTATILRHLVKVGEISGVEAQAMYRCRSLTKRISEIDAMLFDSPGCEIVEREWKRDVTGQRYVRYFLSPSARYNVREGRAVAFVSSAPFETATA